MSLPRPRGRWALISQTARYALKAVLYLARRPSSQPVPAGRIASDLHLPSNYLSKILHILGKYAVVHSARGCRGGFALAQPAAALSLMRVLSVFDHPDSWRGCLLRGAACRALGPCTARSPCREVSRTVAEFLRSRTVADLLASAADEGDTGWWSAKRFRTVVEIGNIKEGFSDTAVTHAPN